MGIGGLVLVTVGILTIPFQSTLDRNGFGQMVAWFRLTVVVIGIAMIGLRYFG